MKITKTDFLDDLHSLADWNGASVCVALSGGSDSVCLLHLMASVSDELGVRLSAVHINHHLRGAEADRDQAFCETLCAGWGIPLTVFDVYPAQETRPGEGIEAAARRLRYAAFDRIGADYIATAHTAEDSLETFLINFLRGSGLKGLCGIPPVRGRFVRPLYRRAGDEILEYCRENKLDFVIDSSNLTDDYTRNRLRHHVVPLLKELNPSLIPVARRNMDLLKIDSDCLDGLAETLYSTAFDPERGLCLARLSGQHRALTSRVMMKYCGAVTGRLPDCRHLEQMLLLVDAGHGRTELFSGWQAAARKGFLSIGHTKAARVTVTTEVVSTENFQNRLKINNLLLKNAIDYDKMSGKLMIRVRCPGDTMRPLGRGVTKPLRRLQAEAEIPADARGTAPVAADEVGVVWAYRVGCDERVRIDQNTKRVLIFSAAEYE